MAADGPLSAPHPASAVAEKIIGRRLKAWRTLVESYPTSFTPYMVTVVDCSNRRESWIPFVNQDTSFRDFYDRLQTEIRTREAAHVVFEGQLVSLQQLVESGLTLGQLNITPKVDETGRCWLSPVLYLVYNENDGWPKLDVQLCHPKQCECVPVAVSGGETLQDVARRLIGSRPDLGPIDLKRSWFAFYRRLPLFAGIRHEASGANHVCLRAETMHDPPQRLDGEATLNSVRIFAPGVQLCYCAEPPSARNGGIDPGQRRDRFAFQAYVKTEEAGTIYCLNVLKHSTLNDLKNSLAAQTVGLAISSSVVCCLYGRPPTAQELRVDDLTLGEYGIGQDCALLLKRTSVVAAEPLPLTSAVGQLDELLSQNAATTTPSPSSDTRCLDDEELLQILASPPNHPGWAGYTPQQMRMLNSHPRISGIMARAVQALAEKLPPPPVAHPPEPAALVREAQPIRPPGSSIFAGYRKSKPVLTFRAIANYPTTKGSGASGMCHSKNTQRRGRCMPKC